MGRPQRCCLSCSEPDTTAPMCPGHRIPAKSPLHKTPPRALHLHLPHLQGKLRRKETREREIALRSSSNSQHLPPTRREVRRLDGGNWHHPAPPLKTAQGSRAVKGDKNTPLPSWTSSPFNQLHARFKTNTKSKPDSQKLSS